MEKTSFITEWGTYCYRVMSFRLKNAGATNHRAATTLFHDMMHQDVEAVQIETESKKYTFGVTSTKLLVYMVSERDIKVDLDKIRVILDMPAPRTERECQRAFERVKEYLLSPPILVHPTPGCPSLLYLSVSDVALGCMLAQLDDSAKDQAIYDLKVHQRKHCCKSHSFLPVFDVKAIDDDFPDEDVAAVSILSGWRMYFDGAANHSGYGIGVLLISFHGLEMTLELGIRQMEAFGDSNMVLRHIQGEWKTRDVKLRPYLAYLELLRYVLTYCCLIDDIELDDGLPWYHDIYHFLRLGVYLKAAKAKDKRALRQLAARFVICGETLYKRSVDGMLLLCLDRASANRVMREIVVSLFRDVQICGIDIIGKISSKSSNGHEFILVAIDYFTKWVEAASYARLTSTGVVGFIRSHIICCYRVPHELILDRGANGAVEAMNKNIKRILRRMVETSQDWSEKLPFALWAYRTSFCTSTGATPYSLVYGIEVVLPVEIEMGSLRVTLEQQIPEADWVQARLDQLNLLYERRLRAADHVHAYQWKMARAFKKLVKPRPL
ncbi:hypothetical protein CK203_042131 [Vitis vinifera]|uniref:Reverse transcriptase/retrotransposon-derived protein RNase H-like domain-containing protein n=1 Tax=Vitis vinifera TaxID=29760 RepID=A0A438HPZ1_VITVI|nr:hypothetical protein CK203_042131 [Vitis vinifera]